MHWVRKCAPCAPSSVVPDAMEVISKYSKSFFSDFDFPRLKSRYIAISNFTSVGTYRGSRAVYVCAGCAFPYSIFWPLVSIEKEDFAHPIFGPNFMNCGPNFRLFLKPQTYVSLMLVLPSHFSILSCS